MESRKGKEGKIIRFRGKEGEPPFQDSIHIRIPDNINPFGVFISLLSSVEHAVFLFSIENGNILPTQDNIARALVTRKRVDVTLANQTEGDTVTLIYSGPMQDGGMFIHSGLYRFSAKKGWQGIPGASHFQASKGPQIKI